MIPWLVIFDMGEKGDGGEKHNFAPWVVNGKRSLLWICRTRIH